MSLNRNEKAAVVADVSAQVARSQTLALAEYRGLTVEHLNKLRVDARAKGVYLHVLKNTLARRAVAGTRYETCGGRIAECCVRAPRRRQISAAWTGPASPSAG